MEFGAMLKSARENAGLTIKDVSELTRIRASMIRDLEKGDISSVGGQAYARGHIRSIAKVLGIDPEPLLAEFIVQSNGAEKSMRQLLEENSVTALKPPTQKYSYQKLSYGVISLVVIALLATVFHSFFGNSPKASSRSKVVTGATSSSTPTASPTSTTSTTPTISPTSPTPTTSAQPIDPNSSVIFKTTGGASWISVIDASGAVLYSRILPSGSSQGFSDTSLLNVTIGNAGAVDIVLNGKDLGITGTIGQVIHLQYGPGANS